MFPDNTWSIIKISDAYVVTYYLFLRGTLYVRTPSLLLMYPTYQTVHHHSDAPFTSLPSTLHDPRPDDKVYGNFLE